MQVACNSGPSNMYILVFFDHNHCLMFQSSCFVSFHTKAQRISLFYHFSFLTQRSPWYSWSVCCGRFISLSSLLFIPVFPQLSHCIFLCLSFFILVLFGSAMLTTPSQPFIHFSPPVSLSMTLFLSLPVCVHLSGCVRIVADIRGEIRSSSLIEANLHSHSEAPQRELYSNRGYPAYQATVLSFRPNTLQLLLDGCHGSCNALQLGTFV